LLLVVFVLFFLANGQDTIRDIVINDKILVLTNVSLSSGLLSYTCGDTPYEEIIHFLKPISLFCTSPELTSYAFSGVEYSLSLQVTGIFSLAPKYIEAGIFYYVNTWNQAFLFSVLPGNSLTFLTTDRIPYYDKVLTVNFDYRTTGSTSSIYAVLNKTLIWSPDDAAQLTYSSYVAVQTDL